MTANQSRLLGVALLLFTVGLISYLAKRNDTPDDSAERAVQQSLASKYQAEEEIARARARLEAGGYVLSNKRISDNEQLQIIVIPEGYTPELDTRCIVYKNSDLRTSSITCSGVLFRQPAAPS